MSSLFPQSHRLKDGSTVVLALPELEDAESLVALLNQAGGESDFLTFGANEFWQSAEGQKRAIENARKDGFELILKASIEGELAGSLNLFRSKRPRLTTNVDLAISVKAQFWNKGIGTLLVRAAVEWAKQSGVRKINLRVRIDNFSAIAVYRKLGFVDEGNISRAIEVDGKFYSELFMGLTID